MVRPCAVEHCDTNRRQYSAHTVFTIPDRRSVFKFPRKRPELYLRWVEFIKGGKDSKSLECMWGIFDRISQGVSTSHFCSNLKSFAFSKHELCFLTHCPPPWQIGLRIRISL